jgi:hypothetical protein
MSGFAYGVIADSTPCEAREHGCHLSVDAEIVGLAVVAVVFICLGLLYVNLRWDRGPVSWFLRWRRRRAARRDHPDPFG